MNKNDVQDGTNNYPEGAGNHTGISMQFMVNPLYFNTDAVYFRLFGDTYFITTEFSGGLWLAVVVPL